MLVHAYTWSFWIDRNAHIFEDYSSSIAQVVHGIKEKLRSWAVGSPEMKGVYLDDVILKWEVLMSPSTGC